MNKLLSSVCSETDPIGRFLIVPNYSFCSAELGMIIMSHFGRNNLVRMLFSGGYTAFGLKDNPIFFDGNVVFTVSNGVLCELKYAGTVEEPTRAIRANRTNTEFAIWFYAHWYSLKTGEIVDTDEFSNDCFTGTFIYCS